MKNLQLKFARFLSVLTALTPLRSHPANAEATPYNANAYGAGVYGGNLTPLPATGAADHLIAELCFAALVAVAIGIIVWRKKQRTRPSSI